MFKNLSIFALAFAFVGLTGCSDDDTMVEDNDIAPATVETEVLPADEMMENEMEEAGAEMEAAGDDMEAGMEEMGNDIEAGAMEAEEEMEEVIE